MSLNNNDHTILRWLHSKGCDVTAGDDAGMTPLHIAARSNRVSCVDVLVTDYRVDVNCRAHNGSTPLYLAASRGHADTIRTLARLDADPNLVGKHFYVSQQLAHLYTFFLIRRRGNESLWRGGNVWPLGSCVCRS
jgi:ankyrin repeat protein